MIVVGMAAIVAARMLFGPIHFGPLSVTTPLNPEGFFGASVTLMLLLGAGTNRRESTWNWRTAGLLSLGVAAISVMALSRALGIYFLSDDFILVRIGKEWTAAAFRYSITHGGGDGFFRPFGYVSFALDARLGGIHPVWWHASSLAIHCANAVLVLFLAKRLGASIMAAGFAGALFAVHGIHPEAVVWIAGRFDLLATFFLLAGFLLFTRTGDGDGVALHVAALACFAVAALTKESAFLFPVLVAGYAVAKRQPLKSTAWYFALAAILFAYRWSLFGGIGGYLNPTTGRPAALSLGLASTLKAVAVRLWTSLYFPLNWTKDPSLALVLLAVAYMAVIIWLAVRARPTRMTWFAAAAILISVIPVLSLLAGSPALAGSRVLYLPSVWFAILLALALDGVQVRHMVAAIVLLFHVLALQHNLGFWEAASAQVKAACETGILSGTNSVPNSINGVPALANGRPECIEIAHNKSSQP